MQLTKDSLLPHRNFLILLADPTFELEQDIVLEFQSDATDEGQPTLTSKSPAQITFKLQSSHISLHMMRALLWCITTN